MSYLRPAVGCAVAAVLVAVAMMGAIGTAPGFHAGEIAVPTGIAAFIGTGTTGDDTPGSPASEDAPVEGRARDAKGPGPVTVAFFDRATDNLPRVETVSFDELADRLACHEFRDCKDGPLFSPTIYLPGKTRRNENVIALTLAVGDFDNGTPPERIRDHLAGKGVAYLIYSTFSSTPGRPKFRAVVPLLHPVPSAEWGPVWEALVRELFLGCVDLGTRDAARIFYLPSAPPGTTPFIYRGQGAPFDAALLKLETGHRRRPLTLPGETGPITAGERRPKLMSVAGRLRNAGAGYDAILAELRAMNEVRCTPRLPDRDLEHVAASACRYNPGPPRPAGPVVESAPPSPARPDPGSWAGKPGWETEPELTILTEKKNVGTKSEPNYVEVPVEEGYVVYNRLVSEYGFRSFRTTAGEPRVAIPTGLGVDVRNPKEDEFEEWVGYRYYTLRGDRVPTREVGAATLALAGRSLAPELPPQRVLELAIRFAKTGEHESLLDLGTPDRRCVRVTPEGWAVETVSMPIFDRPAHLAPLPLPEREGGLDAALRLFEFVLLGLQDSEGADAKRATRLNGQRLLTLASEVQRIVRPKSPKPAPIVTGDEGAGKSSGAERYVGALDPSVVVHLPVPKDEGELLTLAMNRATVSFDNVSSIEPWFSDGLARLITGTGFAKRRLYTDRDEVVSRLIPQVVLNGITANPRYADLIRRCLFLWIVKAAKPKGEDDLSREWKAAHPTILGGLLDLASGTLKELRDAPSSDANGDESMADFVLVGRALSRAIGDRLGSFDEAWKENRARQETASSENPWVSALYSAFDAARKGEEKVLSPEDIARHISVKFPESFPEKVSAQQVGNQIARCRKSLAALGIVFERRKGHGGSRAYALLEAPKAPESPEAPENKVPPAIPRGAARDSPSVNGGSGGTWTPGGTHSKSILADSPPPSLYSSSSRVILKKGVLGAALEESPSGKEGGTPGGTTEAPQLDVPPGTGPVREEQGAAPWAEPRIPEHGDLPNRVAAGISQLGEFAGGRETFTHDEAEAFLERSGYAPAEASGALGGFLGSGAVRQVSPGVWSVKREAGA